MRVIFDFTLLDNNEPFPEARIYGKNIIFASINAAENSKNLVVCNQITLKEKRLFVSYYLFDSCRWDIKKKREKIKKKRIG